MKIKVLAIIFFASFMLTLILSPLRGYVSFQSDAVIGFICYLLLTIYSVKKYQSIYSTFAIFIILIIGRWTLELPIRILFFESTLVSFPDSLMQTIGIICGFLYCQLKKPFSILTVVLGFSITVFMFFEGYSLWIHKLNFGTFTGKISSALPAKFEAFDEQKKLITATDFENKIVLLDFWYSGCGVCFDKFPQLQTVYEKYQNDPDVMILAVNKPIDEDKPNQAFEMIREEGYSFPVVITKDADLAEKFGVKGYPTTFVINRNGQIVYKGDIEGAVKIVAELKSEK